jgi:mannose-1-phosphate guanylyltransferase
MNALLLSAGLGTRFRPLTERVAKPAIPFLNIPLLGYSLYYLESIGLQNLVFNTHHLPQSVERAASGSTHGRDYRVSYSHEPIILGSGGGIRQARELLGYGASVAGAVTSVNANATDDFIVCNADEVILFNHARGLAPLVAFHKASGALATLLTTDHPDAGKSLGGVWADADYRETSASNNDDHRLNKNSGKIFKLGGRGTEPGARHFAGVYVFSPRIFNYMPAGGAFHIFKDCLHKAMAAKETILSFHDSQLTWLDMSSEPTYIASTRTALEILSVNSLATIKSQNLINILNRFHQKVELVAPAQWLCPGAKFSGQLNPSSFIFMGLDSEIGADVEVKGFAVLGAGAKFAQGVIDQSVIAPGVHVNPIASLRNEICY